MSASFLEIDHDCLHTCSMTSCQAVHDFVSFACFSLKTLDLLTPKYPKIKVKYITRGVRHGRLILTCGSAHALSGQGCRQIERKCDSTAKRCIEKFSWLSQVEERMDEKILHPAPHNPTQCTNL